ncbi:MAG: hypothetical protein KDD69_11850 [Bdellovibrionales bacterium]|nr:hypothetical protein [Bdellovibrionales bacterium]
MYREIGRVVIRSAILFALAGTVPADTPAEVEPAVEAIEVTSELIEQYKLEILEKLEDTSEELELLEGDIGNKLSEFNDKLDLLLQRFPEDVPQEPQVPSFATDRTVLASRLGPSAEGLLARFEQKRRALQARRAQSGSRFRRDPEWEIAATYRSLTRLAAYDPNVALQCLWEVSDPAVANIDQGSSNDCGPAIIAKHLAAECPEEYARTAENALIHGVVAPRYHARNFSRPQWTLGSFIRRAGQAEHGFSYSPTNNRRTMSSRAVQLAIRALATGSANSPGGTNTRQLNNASQLLLGRVTRFDGGTPSVDDLVVGYCTGRHFVSHNYNPITGSVAYWDNQYGEARDGQRQGRTRNVGFSRWRRR